MFSATSRSLRQHVSLTAVGGYDARQPPASAAARLIYWRGGAGVEARVAFR
ncbi:MAG: hypothetical protein U0527_15050 [Candidatus Eisenbacteria bacterium]